MDAIEIRPGKKTTLYIGYIFAFLILIDAPLVILCTFTGPNLLVKAMVYGAELAIMTLFLYLLVSSFQMELPVFIYIYVAYILSIALVSVFGYSLYGVVKHTRMLLAPLPPFLLGCYFAYHFGEKRERYIKKIIIFLTILSVISLAEWVFFYTSYGSATRFYSRYFHTGVYYSQVKHTSNLDYETSLVTSSRRRRGFFFLPEAQKTATGLYLENYSAGINAAIAVVLALYGIIAGHRAVRGNYVFIAINLAAVILSTSRSAYLFLFVFLVSYSVIRRRISFALLLCLLLFLYSPFRQFFIESLMRLGDPFHKRAILSLPGYLLNNVGSAAGLIGSGIGSFEKFVDAGGFKYVFYQLGTFGLLGFLFLYFSMMVKIPSYKENMFIVLGSAAAIFLLTIYSGRVFGYKCLGLLLFFLGYISQFWQPKPIESLSSTESE